MARSSMSIIETQLRDKLKGASRIALLGVGSELRGDDAVGMIIAGSLNRFSGREGGIVFRSFEGSTAPENFTGEIKKFKPSHLLIIDSADMGLGSGEFRFIDHETEVSGVSFATHRMPISILSNYICKSFSCCVIILGIQPKILKFASSPSKEIRSVARNISRIIKKIVDNP